MAEPASPPALQDVRIVGDGFVDGQPFDACPRRVLKRALARDPRYLYGQDEAGKARAVADMAAYDAFYKRLIDVIPLKNVTSRFAMERVKSTTGYRIPEPVET